eukprot:TRINITY_DN16989_c0_g1_i1.p1 TRINITY_DN16989_c0_g1~~TRINITY_DN16989_c0_g1_i1.p1  ORF type:complete len:456 (+),score=48.22 TRINITY_DN16989_c0_g1_i1:396-1763(+)
MTLVSNSATWNFLQPANLWIIVLWVMFLLWSHAAAWRLSWTSSDRAQPRRRGRCVSKFDKQRLRRAERGLLTCVVTGATSGIGRASAELLARHGFHVIMGCRNLQRGKEQVSQEMAAMWRTEDLSLEVLQLDLCMPASISKFVTDVIQSTQESQEGQLRPLQLLVNNAGILASTEYAEDGIERTLCSNYVGHFALTQGLLPLLLGESVRGGEWDAAASGADPTAACSVVVTLGSFTHHAVSSRRAEALLQRLTALRERDCTSENRSAPVEAVSSRKIGVKRSSFSSGSWSSRSQQSKKTFQLGQLSKSVTDAYVPGKAYQESKLCMVSMARQLHERHGKPATSGTRRISSITVDPGLVDTAILREAPAWLVAIGRIVLRGVGLMRPAEETAEAILQTVLDAEMLSGRYCFAGNHLSTISASSLARDDSFGERLWRASKKLVATWMELDEDVDSAD